jgi:hypothetical protein
MVGIARFERAPSGPPDQRSIQAELHPGLASRARTCGLLLPKQARCLLRHSQSVGLPRFELGASRSRSVRATKLRYNPFTWTASDSNREPSPCRGVALPIGASSPSGALTGEGTRQPRRPYPGSRRSVPGSLRRSWCSAVQLSSRARHVHPPRRVVLRRDGRNRTHNQRFWRPPRYRCATSLCN